MECTHTSLSFLRQKLRSLLEKKYIGKLQKEGLGEIKWIGGYIELKALKEERSVKGRKLRIRKGLPLKLTPLQKQLLEYSLLHDFFHTPKHQSKIHYEPLIIDQKLVDRLRNHHNKTNDPIINKFQYYDRLAASITRKIRSPIISRYNWQAKRKLKKIDFKQLAKNIQEVANTNIWNLYSYIYNSKELRVINESMNYGHSSLRNHLLVIANLIVQTFG
jgi:hypothetical protein